MDRAEFSKRHVSADRLWIFRVVLTRLEVGAIRVSPTGSRQRVPDHLPRRGHNARIKTSDRKFIPGFRNGMFPLGHNYRVCLFQKVVRQLTRLNVRTVIDEFPDRNLRSQFGETSKMIAVPMSDDQVIDLLK